MQRRIRTESDREAARGIFNAVEVQRLPVRKAFYQANHIGSGWQVPAMQERSVYTDFVRREPRGLPKTIK